MNNFIIICLQILSQGLFDQEHPFCSEKLELPLPFFTLESSALSCFTNSEFGCDVVCFSFQYETRGEVADSMLVNTILTLVYVTKFFWWEAGYWNTMDIAHDRGQIWLCDLIIVSWCHVVDCVTTKSLSIRLQLDFISAGDAWSGYHLFILLLACTLSIIQLLLEFR